jgi:Spy/CpxP family protein refolding chaperone
MKSAYELAMERLNKTTPSVKLTADQKQQLAELDSRYAAKTAEREIGLKSAIDDAAARGDVEEMSKLQEQLTRERKAIQAELEEKKEQVRQSGSKK